MFWLTGLGSVSRTMGSTTTMAATSTMAPIRRRLARRLSWSSSSLIARAIYCRHPAICIGLETQVLPGCYHWPGTPLWRSRHAITAATV